MQMISNQSMMVLGVLLAGILLLLYIMRRRVRLGRRVGKF